MKVVMVFAFLLVLAASVRADSIDDSEAKRRGIAVEQIQLERDLKKAQARIAELEKELTATKSKVAAEPNFKVSAASATEKGSPFSITNELKAMPPEIRPKAGESAETLDARSKWLRETFQNRRLQLAFEVGQVNTTKAGRIVVSSATDSAIDFYANCEFSPADPIKGKVKPKDKVVIEGSILSLDISGGIFGNEAATITFTDCKIVSEGK